ncbi:hypothetical protein H4219_004970 [Mycoemilia scoparia]|uniref:Uncharacterized protein n=1 Tax=Mycoemilia scoparia TaxID=417184 RepID=A0A9W7ZXZ1_9FUNG|nr:hypothetical protein H4219_004970 [Mycoemilia scoparia]
MFFSRAYSSEYGNDEDRDSYEPSRNYGYHYSTSFTDTRANTPQPGSDSDQEDDDDDDGTGYYGWPPNDSSYSASHVYKSNGSDDNDEEEKWEYSSSRYYNYSPPRPLQPRLPTTYQHSSSPNTSPSEDEASPTSYTEPQGTSESPTYTLPSFQEGFSGIPEYSRTSGYNTYASTSYGESSCPSNYASTSSSHGYHYQQSHQYYSGYDYEESQASASASYHTEQQSANIDEYQNTEPLNIQEIRNFCTNTQTGEYDYVGLYNYYQSIEQEMEGKVKKYVLTGTSSNTKRYHRIQLIGRRLDYLKSLYDYDLNLAIQAFEEEKGELSLSAYTRKLVSINKDIKRSGFGY